MIYYNLFVFQRSKTVKPHTRTRISILYKYMCVYLIHNNTTRKRYFIYIYILYIIYIRGPVFKL